MLFKQNKKLRKKNRSTQRSLLSFHIASKYQILYFFHSWIDRFKFKARVKITSTKIALIMKNMQTLTQPYQNETETTTTIKCDKSHWIKNLCRFVINNVKLLKMRSINHNSMCRLYLHRIYCTKNLYFFFVVCALVRTCAFVNQVDYFACPFKSVNGINEFIDFIGTMLLWLLLLLF